VLGADLTNEAPLLDLALFRARENGAGVFVASLRGGRVHDFASAAVTADPRAIAELAMLLAKSVSTGSEPSSAPAGAEPAAGPAGAEPSSAPAGTEQPAAAFVAQASRALAAAERPLVVTGTQHRDAKLFASTLAVVDALNARPEGSAWLCLAATEANTIGVALLDAGDGPSVSDLLGSIESGDITALVVCENDLFSRCADTERLAAAVQQLDALYVFDHLITPTAAVASRLLPVATALESSGTLVNNEGRMQRFFEVLRPLTGVAPAWRLFHDALMATGEKASAPDWQHLDDVTAAMAERHPALRAAPEVAPPAGFRQAGQPVPRMAPRFSGRNAVAQRHQPSADSETALSFSMEGFPGPPPAALQPRVWAPGWNSNEAINQFQIEVGGSLHGGDPGRRVFSANGGGPTAAGAAALATTTAPDSGSPKAANSGDALAAAAAPDSDGMVLCATAEIFGSDVTSRRGPAIGELTVQPYLLLHPDRATALGVEAGRSYRLALHSGGTTRRVELSIDTDASLAGYPETQWWQHPEPVEIEVISRLPAAGDASDAEPGS